MADNKISINIKANMDADSVNDGLNKVADSASKAQSELSGLQKAGEDAADVFAGMNFDDFFVDEDEIEETIDDVKKLGNEAKSTKSELDGIKKSIDNIGNSTSSSLTSELGDLNEIYKNIRAATEVRKQVEEEEKEDRKRRAAEERENDKIRAEERKRETAKQIENQKSANRMLEKSQAEAIDSIKRKEAEASKEREHLRKKELEDQKRKLEQEKHDHRIAELEKREEIRRTADEERQLAKEAAEAKKKADKEAAEAKKKEAKEAAEAEKKAAEEAAAARKVADEERVRKARERISTMWQLEKVLNEIENNSGNQRNDWLDSMNNSLKSLGDSLPALEKEINKQFEDTGNYVEVIVDNIDNMTKGLTKFDTVLTNTKEKWGDLAGIKYEPEFWPESFDNNIDAGSWKIDKQGLNLDTSNPALSGVVEAVSKVSNSMDAVNSKIQKSEELVGNIEKIFPNLSKYVDMSVDSSGEIVANLDAVSAGMAVLKEVAKIVSKYFDDWDKTFDKVVDSSTQLVSSLGEGLENSLNNILELCGDVGEALVNGFDNAVDLIGQLISELENAASKVKDLADTGVELTNKWFKLSRILGSENSSDGSTVLGSLSSLYNLDADNIIDGFNSIEMMLTKIGASSKESASAVSKLMLDLSAASNEDFSSIAEKVNSAITMGYIGNNNIVTRLLFNTEAEKKAFKSLSTEAERAAFIFNRMSRVQGAMAEYMNTSAGKVRQLNESISSLNGNVSRLAMGLLAQLAPVLTKIIQLVDYAVQRLTQLLGLNIAAFGGGDFGGLAGDGGTGADALSGNSSDSGSSKKDKAAKKNKELAKSIKEVDQAAKEAQRSVASFDDVIQLPENKETIADSLDGLEDIDPETLDDLEDIVDTLAELGDIPFLNGGLNFGNLLPNDIDKRFEKLKDSLKEIFDLMEKNKFFEAGQKLNKLLQELISDIPWDKIQEKAASAGEHIAEFLNGLFKDEELGYKIGENLAETLNTAFTFLYKIVTGTNFEEIGEFISESVIGLFENLDAEKIGGTIIGVFNDIVDFVSGALKNLFEKRVFEGVPEEIDTGIELIAYKISELLNTIIDGFDPERTLTVVTTALDEILLGIMVFTDNLKYEELGDKLWTFFSGAFDYAVDRFNLLFPVLVEGIVKNINSIFTKLDGKKLGQQLGSVIKTVISSIGRIIDEIDWSEIGSDIGATLQGILENIDPVEAANNVLDLISSILEMVGSMLQEIDTEELVAKVKAFFERLFTGFAENKEQWAGVISQLSSLFINLIDTFFGAVDSTHLVSTIQTFLEQAGIFDAISRWVEAEWQVKISAWFIKVWGKLKGKLGEIMDNIVIPGLLTIFLGPLAGLAWIFKDKIAEIFSDIWDTIKGWISGTTSKSEDEVENDSAEAGEKMVGSIKTNIGEALIKWLDDHGLNITKKIKEAGKAIKEAINGIVDWFKQKWQSFKTKVGNAWDNILEFCDSVKETFNDLVNKVKNIFDLSNWIEVGMGWINNIKAGIAQAWNDLVNWIKENIHLPEIDIKLPSFLKSPSIDVEVPKLATGGIVTRSTLANIGEAGPEAILPLTDSSWMDSLAEKIAAGINSGDTSEKQVNIDLNSFTKPYYSQAEMLEFGRQVVQGLQLVGVNVSTV